MQPIGGWQKLQNSAGNDIDLSEAIRAILTWRDNSDKPRLALGTPTKVQTFIEGVLSDITVSAVKAAISDDGGVFTDETADANDVGTDDVVLVPASPMVNDAFYIGLSVTFGAARVVVSTVATDGAVTWEYFNGTSFVALSGVVDGTTNFTTAGSNLVTFTIPSDWATTTVNSQGPFFFIRARVTTAGTTTALGTQIFCESGVTAGQTDATTSTGNYGQGAYGTGNYGVGDPALGTLIEATSWQFDAFGQLLVAVSIADGKLYEWSLSAPPDGLLAPILGGAPINNKALVVTPERFLFALGANGIGRQVKWADQESLTDWTITATNQAGDFPLSTTGTLMAGRAGRGETLLWTDVDLWSARFIGGTLVYSFRLLGAECGVISRNAMAMVDGKAFWMGERGFFAYDGFVRGVPSEVSDFVFNDINRTQASKIFAIPLAEFREVTWYYPSAASTENNRYVTYDWGQNHWTIGELERTAGADQAPFFFPIKADAQGGVYDHERGFVYLDTDDLTTLVPDAESGPIEIAEGDRVMDVNYIIPDEGTLGDVNVTFFSSFFPNEAEVTRGPFTLTKQTSVRFAGRQVRMKVAQVSSGWRLGVVRLDVEPGGRR